MLIVALVGLALITLGLVLALLRISSNVGVLTLEELARRNGVVYAPISRKMAEGELATWSKPLRLRLKTQVDQPVAQIIFTTKLRDDEEPA